MTEDIRFFLPGPTYVLQDVREAMTPQPMGHRSPDFKALYASAAGRLPQVFRTSRPVMVITGSGSLVWDMAIASCVDSDILNLTNGAFSERFHLAANCWGKKADRIEAPWGEPLDPDLLRQALRRKKYEAVTLAHNETSTGVLNPLAEIAQVVRQESDALLFVDAVSSLAGAQVETEAWGIDLLFTGGQKALAIPPGVAAVTVSERLLERARQRPHRGYYTDLVRYADKHESGFTVTTPAVPQIRALDRQVDHILEEGMEARWQRHLDLRRRTEEWVAGNDFSYASSPASASPTVSCLRPPAGIDAPTLVRRLKEEMDIVIGGGYGKWKPETFRIGHMGEVRMKDLEVLLAAIDELVASS